MQTFATFMDVLLYAMFCVSIALCIYKVIDLWWHAPKQLILYQSNSASCADEFLLEKEKGLTLLGIVASIGPFVGLMATVMHIVVALQKIEQSTDISIVSGPIATALTSTLIGLCAAVPALVVYNLAQRKLILLEHFFQKQQPQLQNSNCEIEVQADT